MRDKKQEKVLRIVTATSLFDGHDAAINIMRRVMQAKGVEVIHLGHNRSADEIVKAAIQEDADAIAVSCYQGGHLEFYKYIIDLLHENNASGIKVFGGGGGVILAEEIREIEAYGAAKIYSPEDGRQMGLENMIQDLLDRAARVEDDISLNLIQGLKPRDHLSVARIITRIERARELEETGFFKELDNEFSQMSGTSGPVGPVGPVLGVTGTGGAGKSSLVDELILRFLNDFPDKEVAVLSVDPTRQRTGGALLGDRIRMNTLARGHVFMRSLATRSAGNEISAALPECIRLLKKVGFDLIVVETAGIGQADAAIPGIVDFSLYVMTAEFGAPSQLEKIEMLDFADLVCINKFDRQGSEDAFSAVQKQYMRNREEFDLEPADMPVFGTMAAHFNDEGVTALYLAVLDLINDKFKTDLTSNLPRPPGKVSASRAIVIPPERSRYLSEVAMTIRDYHKWAIKQSALTRLIWQIAGTMKTLNNEDETESMVFKKLQEKQAELGLKLSDEIARLLEEFSDLREKFTKDEMTYEVSGREISTALHRESLSGTMIPKLALPGYEDEGQILHWLLTENLPGHFPFTAGVFPFRREDEEPTRMFAGEGDPARTNRRFKYLSANYEAKRLSTAFDSVTLYGQDPDRRPDVYGKVGTSGVSISTLDDVKELYSGFDLTSPSTSISMTINGPAPMMLAMYFNAAIDNELDNFREEHGKAPSEKERMTIKADTLKKLRGTIQADILKEDQGQNTCIFSIEFALKMMGDIQEYFIEEQINNFYSVSISGYHIAEAGANPITQAAFTLANGFSYIEYYLSRGMDIDEFAPNLSFFFSNGLDPEYAVINRVARRIWAIALKQKYGANERSQKLKAHIQTSGRSLHSKDIQFNDIRTTLQALTAIQDNCNSLHTNSFDEAVTTPSKESVRRALAIQLIVNKEMGLNKNENPTQGSFIIEELTGLVEEAVLLEFDRLSQRGGVLGAMETGYQRMKIQEESLLYETRKMNGELPIIGVNTFLDPDVAEKDETANLELSRATEEEKESQLKRLAEFIKEHEEDSKKALQKLKQTALSGGNIFTELMETVRFASLGQITEALFEVGGQYRRNM